MGFAGVWRCGELILRGSRELEFGVRPFVRTYVRINALKDRINIQASALAASLRVFLFPGVGK